MTQILIDQLFRWDENPLSSRLWRRLCVFQMEVTCMSVKLHLAAPLLLLCNVLPLWLKQSVAQNAASRSPRGKLRMRGGTTPGVCCCARWRSGRTSSLPLLSRSEVQSSVAGEF